jgi:hypothetical protein
MWSECDQSGSRGCSSNQFPFILQGAKGPSDHNVRTDHRGRPDAGRHRGGGLDGLGNFCRWLGHRWRRCRQGGLPIRTRALTLLLGQLRVAQSAAMPSGCVRSMSPTASAATANARKERGPWHTSSRTAGRSELLGRNLFGQSRVSVLTDRLESSSANDAFFWAEVTRSHRQDRSAACECVCPGQLVALASAAPLDPAIGLSHVSEHQRD